MRVKLTRFRICAGKSGRVDQWLQMLNDRMPETLATLQRERMKVEVIFRESVGGEEYLTWFVLQEEGGESVHTSPHEVDRLHLEFWEECIDTRAGAIDAVPQVVMVPQDVARAMGWANPAGCAIRWAGESSVKPMRSRPAGSGEGSATDDTGHATTTQPNKPSEGVGQEKSTSGWIFGREGEQR
jgi:hypothetical protein